MKLHQKDYKFLDYDSWLDCSSIMAEFVDYEALVNYFSSGNAISAIVGELTKADKKKVYDIVSNSPTLALNHIKTIKQEIKP